MAESQTVCEILHVCLEVLCRFQGSVFILCVTLGFMFICFIILCDLYLGFMEFF